MNLRTFFLIIIAATSTSAIGQVYTNGKAEPADIPPDKTLSITENRRIMYDFASCIVRARRQAVERYLNTAPGSVEAKDMSTRLASNSCLRSGQLKFQESLFRAAAYDVMYRAVFITEGPTDFSSVTPIDYAQRGEGQAPEDAVVQSTFRQLADCAVRHGAIQGRNLILSPVGSADEAASFASFTPLVSACMTRDLTLKFSKFVLRGFVGEVLYRLSVAARNIEKAG